MPNASTRAGSCVRDPAWSMAAVREVEEPTVKLAEAPATMLLSPKAKRSWFGRVEYPCFSPYARETSSPSAVVIIVRAIAEGIRASHIDQSMIGQVSLGGPAGDLAEHVDAGRLRVV